MAVIINASTSTGLVQSADTSGIIQFQSNGSTKATLNSSGFSYPGGVLQVVNAVQSSGVSTTSGTFTDTGLSISITPTSATSKILVIVSQTLYSGGTTNVTTSTQLLRGSTVLVVEGYSFYVGDHFFRSAFNYLDSPATTSTTTYKTQFKKNNAGGTSVTYAYGDSGGQTNSYITLMEIAA